MEPTINSHMQRQQTSLISHPDLFIKKNKIFKINDPSLRKTKIICTIGYININNYYIDLQVAVLKN